MWHLTLRMQTSTTDTAILSQCSLGTIVARNRIAMAPVTRTRALPGGAPSALMEAFYRARRSAGLIVTEATAISGDGYGYDGMPGLFTDAHEVGWAKFIASFGQDRPPLILQLQHSGRVSHSSVLSPVQRPWAASSIANSGKIHTPRGKQSFETPRRLGRAGIERIISQYRCAAIRALRAGFDGVEINCAFGNLLDGFLQSCTNRRDDDYGGSLAGRMRLVLRIIDEACEIFGCGRVGLRVTPNSPVNDMGSPDGYETYLALFKEINRRNLAYLHITVDDACLYHGRHEMVRLHHVRAAFSGSIIAAGCFDRQTGEATRKVVEDILGKGLADIVAFGRAYMSNENLMDKIMEGGFLYPPPENELWYSRESDGYVDLNNKNVN